MGIPIKKLKMTRYPKSGKGNKWTVKELEAIPMSWKGESLSGGNGLAGEVRVSSKGQVTVAWRYGFKSNGKKTWHYCGAWPTHTLAEIHQERDAAKSHVSDGIRPIDQKQVDRLEKQNQVKASIGESRRLLEDEKSVFDMYKAWLSDGVNRKDGNKNLRRSFEKDVIPFIGHLSVESMTEDELRSLLRSIVQRGASRTAVQVYNDIVQWFSWSEKRKPWRRLMSEGNPADLIEIARIVPANYFLNKERSRVFSSSEIRELRTVFKEMDTDYELAPNKRSAQHPLLKTTQIALWLCLSTCCRIGELLLVKWIHIDFRNSTWLIPPENSKRTKGENPKAHEIWLSDFARSQFQLLQQIRGDSDWCFPARNALRVNSHVDLNRVKRGCGPRSAGCWGCVHGWTVVLRPACVKFNSCMS